MENSSRKMLIVYLTAVVVCCCCCCIQEASAAPRNGQNRMPVRSSNNNHNYNNNYGPRQARGQSFVEAAEQQVDPEESNQSEINDESGAVDPEFASLTDDGSPESAASSLEGDESDEPASASSSAQNQNSWLGPSREDAPLADELLYGTEPRGQDSNIANAKIRLSSTDMSTAAGHHHHHGHGVHGWLEMGAHTGKKGAFGWHDKHPVGGKGRR